MSGDLNGVAHVILTAGDFARSTAFWRDLIGYLGLKIVLDSDAMFYGVGGRTAIGIRTPSPENVGKRFDQGARDRMQAVMDSRPATPRCLNGIQDERSPAPTP